MASDPVRSADIDARRTCRLAYGALVWVGVFFAFHVYWYAGGSFASPGELPGRPHTPAAWIFAVLVAGAFPVAAVMCLAIGRGWAPGRLAKPITALAWFGSFLLLLRGSAGVIDDLTRMTGLFHNGITGLSDAETTGVAHPSANLLWSGRAIDAYFLAGGVVFGLLACRYRAQRPFRPSSGPEEIRTPCP